MLLAAACRTWCQMSRTIVTWRHACCSLNAEGLLCILKLGPHVRTAISTKYVPHGTLRFEWTKTYILVRTAAVYVSQAVCMRVLEL